MNTDFYLLHPEVPGSAIEGINLSTCLFQGWEGDALLECYGVFFASKDLCQMLKIAGLTGIVFRDALAVKDEQFALLYPEVVLPLLSELIPSGSAGIDDFGLAKDVHLYMEDEYDGVVVSTRSLQLIRAAGFSFGDSHRLTNVELANIQSHG